MWSHLQPFRPSRARSAVSRWTLALFLCLGLAAGARATVERTERTDETLLILDLQVGAYPLGQELFAYDDPRGVLLPLRQLVGVLELDMEVDVVAARVEGWVRDPEQTFALDLGAGTVQFGGIVQPLPEDALVEAHRDDLYVAAHLLARWWSVELAVDLPTMGVELMSEPPLAIEERLERRTRWQTLPQGTALSGRRSAGYPRVDNPYRWIDWPAVEGTLDIGWQRSGDEEGSWIARASGLAQGDFLAMNAHLFWSATSQDGESRVTGRRLTFSRHDPEDGLLGKLRASALQVGDLSSLGHPLITHGRSGRGLELGRLRRQATGAFDQTTLRGDGLPGWDAELYRNEQLLDYQTLGSDGRYEFRDVPLLVGPNVLRVSLFGPHGERRDVVERIVVGNGALPAGETRYRWSVLEQGRGLLGDAVEPGSAAAEVSPFPGDGEWLFGGTVEHGLSRRWTASLGVLGLPDEVAGEVENRQYAWLGLEGSLWGTAGRVEWIRDLAGGSAARLVAQRRLGSLGIRFEHRQLMDFSSEIEKDSALRGATEVRFDGRLAARKRMPMPFSIQGTWDQRDGRDRYLVRGELNQSARLGKLHLANRWSVEVDNEDVASRGRSTLHGRLWNLPLRGRLAYELWPEPELRNLSLDLRWQPTAHHSTSLELDYDVANHVAMLRASLERPTASQILTMALEASTDSRFAVRFGTRLGLRRSSQRQRYRWQSDTRATQGVVEALVYLDHNGNGTFDGADEPLPEVAFDVDGGRHAVATDSRGVAALAISNYRQTELTVAEGTLDDPYWLSTQRGFAVQTRPGQTCSVEFPIVVTGEVDGTVCVSQPDGCRAVGGIVLELLNPHGEVVATTRSQYDGFYLLEKILPGSYRLAVAPETVQQWNLQGTTSMELEIGLGTVHSEMDFQLELQTEVPRPRTD